MVFRSGVKFKFESSGNYNSQIMEFLNYAIKLPNKVASFDSDESSQKDLTLGKKFMKDMEKIFRKVEVQENVFNMKKFDPKHPEKVIEVVEYKK